MSRDIKSLVGKKIMITETQTNNQVVGTLQFFNFNQNVIHVQNYVTISQERIIENGEFRIFNTNDWKNLRKPDPKTLIKISRGEKMGTDYKPYEEVVDNRGLRSIRMIRDNKPKSKRKKTEEE